MNFGAAGHLTYCSNIHPGETWPDLRRVLLDHVPAIRRRLAPGRPFGLGLRLAAPAAHALAERDSRDELRRILAAEGLYVFTVNGFPYGRFHGGPVKEAVYRPDWLDPERLVYTNLLAGLLAELMPDDPRLEGSVSTVPGCFRPRAAAPQAVERMTAAMVRHAAHLVALRRETGRTVVLALEPEPCCFMETVAEAIAFFRDHLFAPASERLMATLTGLPREDAGAALRRHLGLCLDLCHAAVEFEQPEAMLDAIAAAGIRIAKVQVTAGLRLSPRDGGALRALRGFEDGVYLHQVVERTAAGFRRFPDLPQAFAGGSPGGEWRVHFHVPLFVGGYGPLASTSDFVRSVLARHRARPLTDHLEVETYTWEVLPAGLRDRPVAVAIAEELRWVEEQLAHEPVGGA